MLLEGSNAEKFNDLVGNQSRDLPACSIVPPPEDDDNKQKKMPKM
jgi:hypothetical protein